eukprot:2552972-Rhodomonas_salina.1
MLTSLRLLVAPVQVEESLGYEVGISVRVAAPFRMVLCLRYAMPGTDCGYAATSLLCDARY